MPETLSPTVRATRRRILAAAGELFAEHGVRGLPVRELLARAEISRRTFYQHFDNLDAVAEQLYAEAMDAMLGALVEGFQQAAPGEQVRDGVAAYLQFHLEQGPLLTVLMAESMSEHSPLAARREEALVRFENMLSAATFASLGHRLDPLMYRALFTGLGSTVMAAKRQGRFDAAGVARLSAVMRAMILQVVTAGVSHPEIIAASDAAEPEQD